MTLNPVENNINFIDQLKIVGRKQQNLIENKNLSNLLDKDIEKNGCIFHTKKLYIENFWNITEFLVNKLRVEKDEFFSYYFPLTRTLTEIYSELIYFSVCDDDKKFKIYVAQYLFQLSQTHRYTKLQNSVGNDSIKKLYEDFYLRFKAGSLGFPENIENFTKRFLEDSGFNFPKVETVIKQCFNFEDFAKNAKSLFPTITKESLYNMHYRIPSDFLHGKIYIIMKPKDKPQNEKWWLIAHLQIKSFLLVEFVDKVILNLQTQGELKKLSEEFTNIRIPFINLWRSTRAEHTK